MNLFEKIHARCEVRDCKVEILMVTLKKGKSGDAGTRTPIRCQSSGDCPRSSFCRFVNPLTTRLPVTLESPAAVSAAEAS